jgi:hypothetical protein
MDENRFQTNHKYVVVVLCESDQSNALALKHALRFHGLCDHFVVVGDSEFVKDALDGYGAEFVSGFEPKGLNVTTFDAAAMAKSTYEDGYLSEIENAYQAMTRNVDRVRAIRLMKSNVLLKAGEAFQPGEVWMTPKGFLYRVMGYEDKPGKAKQAILRTGIDGAGRKVLRDWDAVSGWVLQHAHA